MRAFFTEHKYAILLSLLVGCITGLPSSLMPLIIGTAYHGIPYFPLSDEYHYLANIHEILDGHWNAASTFLYEYKSMPATAFPVNEWFYVIPSYLFGTVAVALASKFILPGLLFLLTYWLLLSVLHKDDGASKLTAIAGGLFVALGAEFVNYSYVLGTLKGGIPVVSLWTRMVNPIMGGVQLMAFLIALWNVWDRQWRYAFVVAGVILASTVGYFFTFGISLAILGALFLITLAKKEFDILKQLFYIGVISTVLDAGWWYSMLTTLGGEEGRRIAMLNGMFFTHKPVLNLAVLVASIMCACLFAYSRYVGKEHGKERALLFIASLLLGCWIAFNQQIITGREVWYYHFVQYTVPLCMIAVIAAAHLALSRQKLLWNISMYALCAVMISYGLYSLTTLRSESERADFVRIQLPGPVFSWLDAHSPADCVVLVNPNDGNWQEEEGLIPAMTHCNTYTVWDPALAMTPERDEHNFLLRLQMLDVKPANVKDYLVTNQGDVRGFFYTDWNQAFGYKNGMEPWIVDRIDILSKDYQVFAKIPLETSIKKYRADYLLSNGPISPALSKSLPDLSLATTTGSYYLYSFPAAR